MDPLQHLVAPRRPLPSPRTKARDGVSKNVFTLPVIHQFEPVLASSPKSYMVANASKKRKESAESVPTGIGTPPVISTQPQRPKSREGVGHQEVYVHSLRRGSRHGQTWISTDTAKGRSNGCRLSRCLNRGETRDEACFH
ncbi:hypothetical protein GQ600_5962 [Phytophthora cactorum]|nr:hypothetical protein GQ600_5962 [Phytophthora cactorum]